jgi:HSP20 family molecular chaperone IbpA
MSDSGEEEWEENMLKEMAKLFSTMGMNVDYDMLKSLMHQLKARLEEMGMNPEDMAKTNVKMDFNKIDSNLEPQEMKEMLKEMMRIGNMEGFGDFLKNMGINMKINEPVIEVKAEINDSDSNIDDELVEDNFYIHEDRMYLTVDISRYTDLESNSIELNLADAGISLQIMKTTQLRPFKKFNLPEPASRIIEWTFNNGVLDVTFDINSTMYI